MAKDGNQDNTAAVPTVEASIKEPSFEGRLQLNDFMFKAGPSTDAIRTTASSSAPPGMRRSARLLTTSRSSSSSSSTSPLPSTAQTPLSKSKTRGKPTTLSSQPSSSTASPKRKPSTNTNTTTTTTAPYFPSSSSPRIKKRRARQTYAPPSTYAHLPLLPDALGPELLVLFVGLNPGLETARTGHAYAHPSNLFWKLLRASGLTPGPAVYRAADDRELPRRCGLGLTNIVARPTRSGAELTRAEMDAGVAALEAKCRACRPECVCLVGKAIWESVVRVRRGRPLAKGEFAYGWQGDERFGAVPEGEGEGEEGTAMTPWEGARIFVATSTSGLAASLRPEEKERIWKVLGDWCVERRKEREREREREREKEEKEKADGSVKTEKGRGEEANASETIQPGESEP
ncbi:DNA glycosylase [Biscogniauxia mediterranea]|nr:DNA glycosylase [Biscogniauxia mediterranea]